MAALHIHHEKPRHLLRLHREALAGEITGEGIEAWLTWEDEATRYGVDVEIAPEDLAELIEGSTVVIDTDIHRRIHGSDWQRWGRRGGLRTLQLYGTAWFSAMALKRWGRITAADLDAMRVVR